MLLQDIKDDLELMTLPDDVLPLWVWVAGAAAAGLLGIGVWLTWRLVQRKRRREATPEQAAEADLARLKTGEGRALYIELSAILAKYLAARYGIATANLTSREIRVELRRKGALARDAGRAVDEFLNRCDRGKFGLEQDRAAAEAAVAACEEAIRQLSLARMILPQLAPSIEGDADAAA